MLSTGWLPHKNYWFKCPWDSSADKGICPQALKAWIWSLGSVWMNERTYSQVVIWLPLLFHSSPCPQKEILVVLKKKKKNKCKGVGLKYCPDQSHWWRRAECTISSSLAPSCCQEMWALCILYSHSVWYTGNKWEEQVRIHEEVPTVIGNPSRGSRADEFFISIWTVSKSPRKSKQL